VQTSRRWIALSEALDIDQIALSEVRLLKEARHGNPVAFRTLIDPYLPGIWSICRGFHADERGAIEATVAFRVLLSQHIREFTLDRSLGLQVYGLLWRHLWDPMQPSPRGGIEQTSPAVGRHCTSSFAGSDEIIRRVLRGAPPYPRLLYLFCLVTGLPAARLSDMVGETEMNIRMARTMITSRIHEALTQ